MVRSLSSLTMTMLYKTGKCVTLWFFYVDKPREDSENQIAVAMNKAAMMLG